MLTKDEFSGMAAGHVEKAWRGEAWCDEIFTLPDQPIGKNEFLFFIKPEITLPSPAVKLETILQLIHSKIMSFGLNIHSARILSAGYLAQYNIIAQHYGVINRVASAAVANMSEAARLQFRELYGHSVDEVKVLGGIEFLDHYKDFCAYSLGSLWQNTPFQKLAGGTYCVKVKMEDETVYLINGFHPRQLQHFTEKGRSIVVMTLSGDLSWREARNSFIGATDPSRAAPGSIRRELLENQAALGLSDVSPSANGVHLSAGPVEALVELVRYQSDFYDPLETRTYRDFSFGKQLQAVFPEEIIQRILDNVNLKVNGKTISVFDFTEEKDSDEALRHLTSYFKA